ncbi:P-loop NTPase fold protein [Candidatus Omnitrophota bacterium]
MLILFLLAAIFSLSNKKETKAQRKIHPLSDEPIYSYDQDVLGRKKFVENLFKEITSIKFTDSFVFGLYANWGEGKTSVLNLLRNKLRNQDEYITINFEPFYYTDEKAILNAFYKHLEKGLNNLFIFPAIRKMLIRYQELLSPEIATNIVAFKPKVPEESLEEIKERIEYFILSTKKRVLIIIDDIDRLQPNEILLIFKLVRANARFKNTVFLLSCDFKEVIDKLNNNQGINGEEFIKKIIQKPIIIPKIEQHFLDRFLVFSDHSLPEYTLEELKTPTDETREITTYGVIKKIEENHLLIAEENDEEKSIKIKLPKEKEKISLETGEKLFIKGFLKNNNYIEVKIIDDVKKFRLSETDVLFFELYKRKKISLEDLKEFDDDFVAFYRTELYKLIGNLREAKRYLHSLSSSLPGIVKEVNLFDFCLLEFLKVFKVELFDDIYRNWWYYIDARYEGDAWINPLKLGLDEEKKKEAIKEHVQNLLNDVEKDDTKRGIYRSILKKLFPNLEA